MNLASLPRTLVAVILEVKHLHLEDESGIGRYKLRISIPLIPKPLGSVPKHRWALNLSLALLVEIGKADIKASDILSVPYVLIELTFDLISLKELNFIVILEIETIDYSSYIGTDRTVRPVTLLCDVDDDPLVSSSPLAVLF